jgi:hypothetical protein
MSPPARLTAVHLIRGGQCSFVLLNRARFTLGTYASSTKMHHCLVGKLARRDLLVVSSLLCLGSKLNWGGGGGEGGGEGAATAKEVVPVATMILFAAAAAAADVSRSHQ